ncbi:MAG: glucoamylase family protein [Coriobacteriia bacterium]
MPDTTLQAGHSSNASGGEPLRGELLGLDRLVERARELAAEHTWTTQGLVRGTPLLSLVERAGRELATVNAHMTRTVRDQAAVSPSVEWLLDNYYLIEQQVKTVQEDLPADFGVELPRLTAGPLKGFPRVYAAAAALIAHTDARLDHDYLVHFIMAYQDVSPLTIGEVWAVPIMLRVGFVENLRRLAAVVRRDHDDDAAADGWANRLLEAAKPRVDGTPAPPAALKAALADLERRAPSSSGPFLVRFAQRLRDQDASLAPASFWLEKRLASTGTNLEILAHAEQHRRAIDQVSIANSVTSVRFLDALDWNVFFEECSLVEHVLGEDPAGVYAVMDFASRDRYRHALEAIARRCPLSEIGLAEAAVALALQGHDLNPADTLAGHVGRYLVSDGRYAFERAVHYRPRLRELTHRGPLAARGLVYGSLLTAGTAAVAAGVWFFARVSGADIGAAATLAVLAAVAGSEIGFEVVNRLAARVWLPRRLPRLDPRHPVAEAHRTLVVVPALVTSAGAARDLVAALEVDRLANTDPNVHFALLADLPAAAARRSAADDAIVEAAREAIDALNERAGADIAPFHLFVRERRHDPREGNWLGWERKRGALAELVRLLRGASDTSFEVRVGDETFLQDVAFVITLDADTVLPRDAARKLVATIAHPLNRATFDDERRRVVRGYGLVQPRVAMSLPSAERSLYAWLHAGPTGIDPYAGAVSDTYQDVFGEGSFTGKGIFEVDVYATLLENRFPEGRLLSHDLLEGSYLRTALVSDVEVVDDHPASHLSETARMHRWVRGDWQAAAWALPRVPGPSGSRIRSTLPAIDRWKLIDNLRRSLVPPAWALLFATGWALLPGNGLPWTATVLAIYFFPLVIGLLDSVLVRPPQADLAASARATLRDAGRDALRSGLDLATLPHRSLVNADAVARACWRVNVSKHRLLEWVTAAESERHSEGDLVSYQRRMRGAFVVAAAMAAPAIALDPSRLAGAAPLLALWWAGPTLAWASARPRVNEPPPLRRADLATMRHLARATWRFFETFVTPEDHWLAPDNYQEEPLGSVARRTSPTNMGLQLLADLAAHDLGYLSVGGLVSRVEGTLQTMAGLERFRGHFFNWYDTATLQPLRPSYVSTVDSGNLAGHLLVLRAGLLEALDAPLVRDVALAGISDGVRLSLEDVPASQTDDRLRLEEALRRLDLERGPADLGEWVWLLRSIAPSDPDASAMLDDLLSIAPWADMLREMPPELREDGRAAALAPIVDGIPTLRALAEGLDAQIEVLEALSVEPFGDDPVSQASVCTWCARVAESIRSNRPVAVELLARLLLLADIAREMWEHTDFNMLYDSNRKLFSIGFNTAEGRLDDSFYDLLASECRLASFLAIAKGDVPQEHWFRLGRQLTVTDGGRALVSWSASMFEYLMPLLVMESWPDTLLGQTYRAVVRRQVRYGRQRGVPWGVSESAFNAKDADFTYQYQAFGVPGLGLKRGLSDDVVVAPYATLLALAVDTRAALDNLAALSLHGAEGRYGFYEAVDYTPGRVPAGAERAVIKAYFAHHQGMGLLALANELCDGLMRQRFHDDPLVRSAELLLQERVPRHVRLSQPNVEEVRFVRSVRALPPPVTRSYPTPHTIVPATHFLSNGRYSVMVTNAGGGYSIDRDLAVTRYREDITRDCWGTFFYLHDVDSGAVWSATYQPTLSEPDEYHVTFSADKAEYRREDGSIETHTEVVVSPEDDVEVRRLTITNHGRTPRRIEVTSYLEIALAPQASDQAHKAFSNLFLETEQPEGLDALLFSRRPRASDEKRPWGFHTLACEALQAGPASFETDRALFLGRLRKARSPRMVFEGVPLSGTVGPVLDPVCAIRRTVSLGPGETARLAYSTGVAPSRDSAVELASKYADLRSAQRAADLAWTTTQIELRDLGISPEEAVTFDRLASRLLLIDPYSRLKVKTDVPTQLPLSSLWGLGISGDLPILLVRIERVEEMPLARQALLAHQYWRHKGLRTDLVVLNTRPSAYASELQDRLRLLLRTGHALQLADKPGGVFLRSADQMSPEVLDLLMSVARAVLDGDGGPIRLQLDLPAPRPYPPEPFIARAKAPDWPLAQPPHPALSCFNGYGGFDEERHEYVIVLADGDTTPAPWVNVLANPGFGALVSEAGVGCTWALNSHENRISTWNNDPVSDGSGEALYLRDELTGESWSPTPLPIRSAGGHVIRHGRGYTRFEHSSHGLRHEVDWFVPVDDPVRVVRLTLTNLGDAARDLSVTHLVEWSLGDSRSKAQQRVITRYEADTQILFAQNWFNLDFPGRPAFLACDGEIDSHTGSRTEFLGRNGDPAAPAAMRQRNLGGTTGRFHDNCGALMRKFTVEPGETVSVTFLLGQCDDDAQVRALLERYRASGTVEAQLERVRAYWSDTLDALVVHTPDAELDRLLDGHLLYQTLACRVWGRTATYQSSGAYGFRDQLQDALALLPLRPDIARERILDHAARQFPEGDVLHWWQPYSGRGVRTRFSDDRHWLAYVTAEYVRATGDAGVLDEEIPFVEGQAVPEGHEDLYLQPTTSARKATLYEHCVAAFEASRSTGVHGLPLIGSGDWNDGMNRIGREGRGESVWLAWFLDVTLRGFAPLCEAKGDAERAADYRAWADRLVAAVEEHGWDGAWYRRAFFDDGTPLGTSTADECRIDAIAQAWAVVSGRGDRERAERALDAVTENLVRWEDGLVRLLTPPFDHMEADPGYIKGYVPGVRENGGQYTHAAVWVVLAFLLHGDGDMALNLLDLLNPVNHSLDRAAADVYRVEPYVVAADVYAVPPHVGRGGWTWYTGAAAWMHRVAVRNLLGLDIVAEDGERYIVVDPCIPKAWPSYEMTYRSDGTTYRIRVLNPRGVNRGVARVEVDGSAVPDLRVRIERDAGVREVRVTLLGG